MLGYDYLDSFSMGYSQQKRYSRLLRPCVQTAYDANTTCSMMYEGSQLHPCSAILRIYTTNCARFWSFSHGAPSLFALPPEAALERGVRYVQISSISEHASVFFCTMPRSLFSLTEAGRCCRAPLMYPIVTKSVTVNSFLHVHSSSSMKFIDSLH